MVDPLDLDIKKLRLLLLVHDTGSVKGAADRAGMSGPAVSQHLMALERQTGVALLVRTGRSVRLTKAGKVLVEQASRVLAVLELASRELDAAAGLRSGSLHVAAFASSGAALTIPAIKSFDRRHPGIEIVCTEMEPHDAIPAVRSGAVDMAVTHQYRHQDPPDTSGLVQTFLQNDRMLLAAGASNAPATNEAVNLAAYAGSKWATTLPSHGFQALSALIHRNAGFKPKVVFRAADYGMVLNFVAADLCVAVVPELVATKLKGVYYREIAHPEGLTREVVVTTRRNDPSLAVAEMTKCLTQQAAVRRRARYNGDLSESPCGSQGPS
jgi:DNA-binding transcriptional LysR family regulator